MQSSAVVCIGNADTHAPLVRLVLGGLLGLGGLVGGEAHCCGGLVQQSLTLGRSRQTCVNSTRHGFFKSSQAET